MAHFEDQILNDPAASNWLKHQVEASKERDVVDALRDSEILVEVLAARYSEVIKC